MFKVNNKYIRTTAPFSRVSNIDFEQVNCRWEVSNEKSVKGRERYLA